MKKRRMLHALGQRNSLLEHRQNPSAILSFCSIYSAVKQTIVFAFYTNTKILLTDYRKLVFNVFSMNAPK